MKPTLNSATLDGITVASLRSGSGLCIGRLSPNEAPLWGFRDGFGIAVQVSGRGNIWPQVGHSAVLLHFSGRAETV